MSIDFSQIVSKNQNVAGSQIKIEVNDVNLYYSKFKALEDINLSIPSNRVTALIGPSGCGKSSFIKILNRMIELIPGSRIEGTVTIDGQNIYEGVADPVDIRRRVGQIFQKPNPFPFSIYENVAYGVRLQGVKNKKALDEIVEKSLSDAALFKEVKDKLHSSGLELSGGQQQRLCIARALAVQPEVLLMDEPCSALDPISTQGIEDLITKLKENLTVVIVTHNMQQAARVSDFTAFLLSEFAGAPGKLIEFGATGKILTQPKNKKTEDFITGRFG
jgi:phosphate transport system ATP-binding protein